VRQLARLCADAAFVEELRGRHDAAAEWYLRGLRMGSQFYGDGALVQCLVGAALISLDSDGLDRLMANQALSDETLRRVIAECRAAEALPEDLARIWRCDAGMQTWLLEALRDEKDWRAFWRAEREGLGWMEGFPLDVRENPRKAVPDRETFMKALPQAQRFVGELLLRPLCDLVSPKRGLKEMLEDEASKGGEPRVYLKIWGPLLESLANRWCRTELILRATQLRAALVLFERQKGKPADKLDQLVPDYLPIVPEDPFFKAPLRYEKTKDGWRIWSIGQDQKDDGGVLAVAERPWDGPEYVFASGLKSNARKRGPRN
jgi:hypothetical protein